MCVNEKMCEVVDSLQRRNLRKTEPIALPRGESRGRAKNVSRNTRYSAEIGNRSKQEESFLNTVMLAKKEKNVLNAEQNPKEPWYFTHI